MENIIFDIQFILESARNRAYSAINTSMIEAYWQVGKRIVEEEQLGNAKAIYGVSLIKNVSKQLTISFGKGYSETNIKYFRQFYLVFPHLFSISQTVSDQFKRTQKTLFSELEIQKYKNLSWSHFQKIMKISNSEIRDYYLKESSENNWSIRTLDRNISTLYYERLLSSNNKVKVENEMLDKTISFKNEALNFIKNPTVLEFLNLPDNLAYTESELEKALIDNIEKFILELGKGFAFIERQKRIVTENKDYFIDLVFYHYILKCFVVIDLKVDKISHQDVGQMDMYVRMFDEIIKNSNDSPTIGIILCTETDSDIARYSILKGNEQLFATKYKLYLPTEEELRNEIQREKEILKEQFANRKSIDKL